jgi:predicted cupin superfamily sugar epimerase
MPTNEAYWIEKLKLKKHPEGGFYSETYRSEVRLPLDISPKETVGQRSLMTSIYYLLCGDEFSALHRLKSDEMWHFYDGYPLCVHMLDGQGHHTWFRLGRDADAGDVLQCVVPGGCWFGAALLDPGTWALVGCVVAPGFDFRDFELADRRELLRLYPRHRDLIVRLTREE